MFIRPATHDDIAQCAEIYDIARGFMRDNGNPTQWNSEYPGGLDVEMGIQGGTSYVCEDGGEVVATFHFEMNAIDPSYLEIYDGQWLNDRPYAVIHRIAVKHHGKGIADYCVNWCYEQFPNLKIDTHEDNLPMQRFLTKCGFTRCGTVYIASIPDKDEAKRVAYQKG